MNRTKKCTGCSKTLGLAEFNDAPLGKDFKKSRCKGCENTYYKGYYLVRKEAFQKHKNDQALTYIQSSNSPSLAIYESL
jgi:hypothetical protein